MINKEKVENLPGEVWKPINIEGREHKKRYAISNKGRVVSYLENPADARLLSLKEAKGRPPKIRILTDGKHKSFTVHHLVAELFLEKPSPQHVHVVHLDRNTHNNEVENLRWVTKEESLRKVSARKDGMHALKLFPDEEYKVIDVKTPNRNYAITNYGRLISFDKEVEQGFLMRTSKHQQGYSIWRYKIKGKFFHYLLHRLVAEYFVEKPSSLHDYVIHLDHNKANNHVRNLQWVTRTAQRRYSATSPASKANVEKLRDRSKRTGQGMKLNATTVRMIKKILLDPERKTRYKILARQFGVSEMQLHRIKTGENWGWVQPHDAEENEHTPNINEQENNKTSED